MPNQGTLVPALALRRQGAQVGDDLPALPLGDGTPLRHAFVGIAIAEHPGQVTVGGMADTRGAQAGAVGTSIGVGAVTLGAVCAEEDFASGGSLRLPGEGADAGVVFIGNAMQPFAVEARRAHLGCRGDGQKGEQDCESCGFGIHGNASISNITRRGGPAESGLLGTVGWRLAGLHSDFGDGDSFPRLNLRGYDFRYCFRNPDALAGG